MNREKFWRDCFINELSKVDSKNTMDEIYDKMPAYISLFCDKALEEYDKRFRQTATAPRGEDWGDSPLCGRLGGHDGGRAGRACSQGRG